IFISTSRDIEMYRNTLEDNFRGIQYFLNCDAVGFPYPTSIGFDLSNDDAHDNVIKVSDVTEVMASNVGYLGSCSSTFVAPYLTGQKGLVYRNNHYYVPTTTGAWWFSGDHWKTFGEWQALGYDVGSTVALTSTYAGGAPPPPPGSDTTA